MNNKTSVQPVGSGCEAITVTNVSSGSGWDEDMQPPPAHQQASRPPMSYHSQKSLPVPGTSSILTPIEISSGLTKMNSSSSSGAFDLSEGRDFSKPKSTSSTTITPTISTSYNKGKLDDMSKLMKKNNCKWLRREQQNFFITVSNYGVEYDPKTNTYDWAKFRQRTKLNKKTDKTLTKYYKGFIAMCKKQIGQGDDIELMVEPISEEKARRTLERIDLLSKLREDIVLLPNLREKLSICQMNKDTPEWWQPGVHDELLILGVCKNGLGNTDLNVLTDPDLPFFETKQQNKTQKPTKTKKPESKEAVKIESHEKIINLEKNEILVQLEKGEGTLKIEKVVKKDVDNENKDKVSDNEHVKWFREYALQVRLQHIVHCIEHSEWPVSKSFTAYSNGLGLEMDLPVHEYTSIPKRDTCTPLSVEGSEVITITTDHGIPRQTANKKRKAHIAIDVETDTPTPGSSLLKNNSAITVTNSGSGWDEDMQPPPAHVCVICKKGFMTKKKLTRHLHCHAGEKHECSKCFKIYNTKDHLREHSLTHQTQKSHLCTKCGKAFLLKSHLTAHRITHMPKSFSCTHCQKNYKHKKSLKMHIKKHMV